MKIWRMGLLVSVPMACLAVLLAFSGCEGTTNEDSSGVDAYIAAHPYTSASRDTPVASSMSILPDTCIVTIVGQTVAFMASGGDGAFHWGVSDNTKGKTESGGGNQALYTCLVVGENDVIVQDDSGHYAAAHISSTANAMTISPASVSLSGGALNASFAVSGGTPPYSWTSGNTALGTISYSASSSYVATYTAVVGAYGQNIVTVLDADGQSASATITQEL